MSTLSTNHVNEHLPVAIIGAGPIGLAAAAHLSLRKIPFIIFEAGESAGHQVRQWGHVKMFSPWRYCIDKASGALLMQSGWALPDPETLPTGDQIYHDYLKPLAALPQIAESLHLRTRVIDVGRQGFDKMKNDGRDKAPFVILTRSDSGEEAWHEARAVIDASGTWATPNPAGAGGLPAIGESSIGENNFYGIPDVLGTEAGRFANKKVLVIGSGHSAINTLLDLARLKDEHADTDIHWLIRSPEPTRAFGGEENDELPARGQLGSRIRNLVEEGAVKLISGVKIQRFEKQIHDKDQTIVFYGDKNSSGIQKPISMNGFQEVITTTGCRPDFSFLKELRLDIDPAVESVSDLAPLIDPNIHSCGTVRPHGEKELRQPESNFYMVGMKSYGRAPTFLLATGYEQVRSVVAALAGDYQAAEAVELDLPETGVCCTDDRVAVETTVGKSSCC